METKPNSSPVCGLDEPSAPLANNPETILQLRQFDREADYAQIAGWFRGHGQEPAPLAILPLLGVVVYETDGCAARDVAALWLYMDNSVGVCFAEKMVTVPGLGLGAARRALECGLEFLRREAVRMHYGVMVIHAYPATARYLKKLGFQECDTGMSCLWALTSEAN